MDVRSYNRKAWNHQVDKGNRWTVPVGPEIIAAARRGDWQVVLTNTKPVPRSWFPDLAGLEVLCLASGGGQQAPIFAAAGACVTTLDNSPSQLAQDRLVAARERLEIRTVEGDMADLSAFAEDSFGLVFHPVSNCFVPDVRPVWREVCRVLRPGGILLAGFVNPAYYIFDYQATRRGELLVRHTVPYSDLANLTEQERHHYMDKGDPLEFGHTLADQLGGQVDAGLAITAVYEDGDPSHPLTRFLPNSMATRAVKPRGAVLT